MAELSSDAASDRGMKLWNDLRGQGIGAEDAYLIAVSLLAAALAALRPEDVRQAAEAVIAELQQITGG